MTRSMLRTQILVKFKSITLLSLNREATMSKIKDYLRVIVVFNTVSKVSCDLNQRH